MQEFGLRITSPEEEKEILEKRKRFSIPESDGSAQIQFGSHYGYYMDMEGNFQSDAELILKYREMAGHPEVDKAISEIVDEAIIFDNMGVSVKINLDKIDSKNLNDNIKKKIVEEFNEILKLLDFNNNGSEIFRNWYVDGRIYYHVVLDSENPKLGVQSLDYIDPRKIKKVRQIFRKHDSKTGMNIIDRIEEYFVYSDYNVTSAIQQTQSAGSLRIAPDAIIYNPSGLLNPSRTQTISYLHKAIKALNQLRMVEDAMVMYRLARAPERRIFYVDVGTMSTIKANQYVRSLQENFRNKLVYDTSTGEIRDDRKFMSMLEDFWLPRREGGRGTEVSTLPGGQNLGDIEDVKMFQQKLYRSLGVPIGRFEQGTGFSLGRGAEIQRDEMSFSKFISKIRRRFARIFIDILEKQLILKGILTSYEWNKYKSDIWFDYTKDSDYVDLKESEALRDKLDILTIVSVHVGTYFSKKWVQKNILKLTEEEIKLMDAEIKKEASAGSIIDGPVMPITGMSADTVRKSRPELGVGNEQGNTKSV